jgi:hypothetical protein
MSWLRDTLGLPSSRLIGERLRARLATPHPHPLFLFGNQKAGGTAIAGLLAAATGLRAALDLEGTTAPRFARLMRGETTLEDFIAKNAWSFSAPIVKDGNLTFVADALMTHFGVTRAGFILRNPFDNIRSILDRLKLAGDLATLDTARARVNATWRTILSGADLGFAPDHYVSILAKRWQRAAEICEAGGEAFVRVRYEDFLADKRSEIERLARAFGLATPNDIAQLLDRDFQRRGNPATDLRAFFGAENAKRIEEICGATAARLGYAAPQ